MFHLQINRLGKPGKRSRIRRPSGHQAMQIETATTAAAVNPSGSNMWTIGYPVSPVEYDQPRIGEFLERCYYCRKRIPQNADVFMYGDLRAFCSTECRNILIELDNSAKVQLDNPKGKATHHPQRAT